MTALIITYVKVLCHQLLVAHHRPVSHLETLNAKNITLYIMESYL